MARLPDIALHSPLLLALSWAALPAPPLSAGEPPAPAARAVDFRSDIYPILSRRCFECHRGPQARSGERLDDRADIVGEADGVPLAVPGKSGESVLIHAVSGLLAGKAMPPEGERLSDEEIGILRAWIDQGLPWDDELLPPPRDGADHWAFRPVRRPEPPAVKRSAWVRTPVDAFIAREHEARGIAPAPEAERRALIRRVSLDLTGLPPTREEAAAFAGDGSPRAYEDLVERLLASPAYGERWARHWLDVARFAETEGYENNNLRPHAWRYRDHVVRSFNADKPYDLFAREQLAGDEILPYSDENLIATGFLAAARLSGNEQDKARQRNDMLVDVTNAAASAFLGLTLGCAQCHNHKFDPITQGDYYRFQGFFVQGQVTNALLTDPALWKAYEAAIPAEYTEAVGARKAILERARATWTGPPGDPPVEKLVESLPEEERKTFRDLEKKLKELEKKLPEKPQAWAFYSPATSPTPVETLPIKGDFPLPYEPETLKKTRPHILIRGDAGRPGPELEPRWPAVLGRRETPTTQLPVTPATSSRLALAAWIASPANPLTARVWVNRLWQWHFGRGLAEDAGDFGASSPRPVHADLLDWLADELVEAGWSTKHIHRLIVLSSAYRQASRHDAANDRIDPQNALHWRWSPRRLEAEAIRDAALAASGELDRTLGGPSVPPDEEEKRPRRSLYLLQKRDRFPEMQALFDGPPASESCARRHVSTVALQSLYLMNGPFLRGRAEAFARRVEAAAGGGRARAVDLAFETAFSRPPDGDERDAALGLVEGSSLATLCHSLLNLNEFLYIE